MKKFHFFGAIILLICILTACKSEQAGSDKEETTKKPQSYKIGVIYSKTGSASPLGEPEWNATLLLEEEINAGGGIDGVSVEIIFADDESSQEKAIEEMNRFIHDENVLLVLGSSTTGASLAMKGLAMENEVPMIAAAEASQLVEPAEEAKWVFKTPHSNVHAVTRIYIHLQEEGIKKIATLTDSNAYGAAGLEKLEELADEYNIEIMTSESYHTNDTDMSAQLTKIKKSGAEAVIVWGTNPGPAIIAKNMKELGIDLHYIGSHGIANHKFIELAEGGAEGVVIPTGKLLVIDQIVQNDPQYEIITKFYNNYTKKFKGEEPTQFGSYGYDNVLLAVEAIKAAGADRAEIRDYLENKIKDFIATTGKFTFSKNDHNGLEAESMVLAEVKDGKWVLKE
ncbi:ABC transporter substrate-binding protein [Bacillus aquiflavi]|uniref:ABC transporter substrate-binding protein n=1 Tax=Bacillus aquiflavi TaxID=2672567 RepID=A0A6B3VTY8_9BACI|nr:ABC transporter substrate-binding protein [Bacillus aquiflavi]MBA4537504.1 ABC transporter substrate-binding protein [Bacillus aquiflavi]NEY81760.1 ABC transporter substrate-binding protein [Bacillus aquiflavi]